MANAVLNVYLTYMIWSSLHMKICIASAAQRRDWRHPMFANVANSPYYNESTSDNYSGSIVFTLYVLIDGCCKAFLFTSPIYAKSPRVAIIQLCLPRK